MIFSGSSKIKEVFYGDTRIKEVYAGADLVWKRITDTVKFANGGAVDFRKAAPEGFKGYLYSDTIRADKDGFYDFHTTGPSGRLCLDDGHGEFAIIPLTRGNDGVRVFVRHTDMITFRFNEKNIPITITAKPSTVNDPRRTVVLGYYANGMITEDGQGTAAPSWFGKGVDLRPGRYWLTSNAGLYINDNWVRSPGGWVDFDSVVSAHIKLYYSKTRAYLVPGQTL
ncbi:hypothetical protein FRC0316_00170 [Corynebacterium diphtheriae]|nr:hypothetical protein FRC0295_00150 [Corynebacterium diphtheriae]CAB0830882.1 hypothetical protein FRC0316_00170 [Corynebacterium diphtheriae]